jgi:hypothetical protein
LLDHALGFVVLALAEVRVPDVAARIDEIVRGPILVAERAPELVVVVDCNRIRDAELLHFAAHVLQILLERELRRVDADHDEPFVAILLVPRLHVRQRTQAVDARVGPEVDHDDVAAQPVRGERRRVQPLRRAVERRQLADYR